MEAPALVFYILASVALVSAAMVIWTRNVMHSAIYLVLSFLCVAAIYVLLRAEFVAVVQVLVYAGGILILFLFIIMLVNLKEAVGSRLRLHATVSASIGAAVVALMLYVYSRGILTPSIGGSSGLAEGGNLQAVGWVMYREYLLPVEIASVLLLVAMVGVIVLARQKT